jgi:hypothetical protein
MMTSPQISWLFFKAGPSWTGGNEEHIPGFIQVDPPRQRKNSQLAAAPGGLRDVSEASSLCPLGKKQSEDASPTTPCQRPISTQQRHHLHALHHHRRTRRRDARYRNVILKWSHAPFFFAATPYPFPDAVALLQRALAAFGPERVMWGSDFTVTLEFASWAEELFYVRDAAALSPSDKEWILGRTARHVLRWSAEEKTKAI